MGLGVFAAMRLPNYAALMRVFWPRELARNGHVYVGILIRTCLRELSLDAIHLL